MCRITIRHIQETVAEHFEVPVPAIFTRANNNAVRRAILPRHVAMFLARELTGHSYKMIAGRFNRKDHTTARAANLKIQSLISSNAAFASEIAELRKVVGS